MADQNQVIHKTLSEYLKGRSAHVGIEKALKDFPPELYGKKPKGMSHTAWQLLEHIRIALHDLLEFCRNPNYKTPNWPDDYWPKSDSPASTKEWDTSVKNLHKDFQEFEDLVNSPDTDLYARIPWGDGQTIFREILLAGDHTSYHVGQLITLRQLLGAWND